MLLITNLELFHGGEDEGDGGDDDHGEAEQGRHLRRPPRLRVLRHVPAEASQPPQPVRPEVLLYRPLVLLLLPQPFSFRLLLANLEWKEIEILSSPSPRVPKTQVQYARYWADSKI